MQYSGRIARWDDARGYGFVQPEGGGRQLFFHISDYRNPGRPAMGEHVRFTIGTGRDGQPVACALRAIGANGHASEAPSGSYMRDGVRVWIAAIVLALAFLAAIADQLPIWIMAVYGGMGALTYGVYALDKAAAQAGARRVPEAWLHGLDAAFGILGGLLAQQLLRHKTSKPGFAFTSFGIGFMHGFVLAGISLGLLQPEVIVTALR